MHKNLFLTHSDRICSSLDGFGSCSKEHHYQRSSRDRHHCKTQVSLPRGLKECTERTQTYGTLGVFYVLPQISCMTIRNQIHSTYFTFADLGVYKRPFTHLMRSNVIFPDYTQL